VDPSTGKLVSLRMTPTRIKHFRVNRAFGADTHWLEEVLNRKGIKFGTRVRPNGDNTLTLEWRNNRTME